MVSRFSTSSSKNLLDNPLDSNGLYPDPVNLLEHEQVNINVLRRLVGQSIISADQFDKNLVLLNFIES